MPKLTKTMVESLPPASIAWDEVRGFGVRRQADGAPHYFVKYRVDGRQRWISIGRHGSPWTVDSARRKAKILLGLVAGDEDPAAERDWEGDIPTLSVFSEIYLKRHAKKKKPRTLAEDARNLKLHILPALGTRRVDTITTGDVARFHTSREAFPVNANRNLALLSHMMQKAEKWALRAPHSNPCRDVERYEETPRERYLSAEELARFGAALKGLEGTFSPFAIAALRVLAFTGARKDEVRTLKWEHVDQARGIARRETKTGVRNIHLPPPALAVLKMLPRIEGSPWVFPGTRDTLKPVGYLDTVWRKVRDEAKLEGVHLHDLRHAFASVAAGAGDSLLVIGKMLGHTSSTTTQRYAHLSADPVAAVAATTAKRIEAAMRKKPEETDLCHRARLARNSIHVLAGEVIGEKEAHDVAEAVLVVAMKVRQ